MAFQAVFAIITVALISGAIADRAKFATWLIFAGIWATWSTSPSPTGCSTSASHRRSAAGSPTTWRAIDFAGGTAVHINAGVAALALAIVLGKRLGWRRDPMRPHNLTLVMLGAGLLWFGWFGFNAGSAVAASNAASVVWVNTMVATGAACLGWLLAERIRDGHATSLGAASGIVAGLVAITPSCSSVSPIGAIIVGCVGRCDLRPRHRPEVQVRLSTTRSTWSASTCSVVCGAHWRSASWRPQQHRPASTASSTAAASTSSGARQSVPLRCCSTAGS